jgi:hypothetical protein
VVLEGQLPALAAPRLVNTVKTRQTALLHDASADPLTKAAYPHTLHRASLTNCFQASYSHTLSDHCQNLCVTTADPLTKSSYPPPPCTAPHWPTATSAASALATHCLTTSSNLFAACYNSRPLHKASTSLHITVRQSLTATAHMSVLHAAAFALQQPQAPCTRSAPKHANRSQLHTIRALSNPEVYKAVCCNLPLQTPSPRPPIRARCVAPHWPTDTSAASAAKKARWCCCCTTRRHRRLW